ncbi:MAG TPA: DUF2127 domain-containing protein [Acidimicrobiales bacterium]|nr:DUF2127 domain-containing protein [Acidimicrobiales bacterium]
MSRTRPSNRYELLTCAWSGHVLVGTDAATITPDDAALVRQDREGRWYRCLRCDSWVRRADPEHPRRDRVEPRDQIELPVRGSALRDRYVLRLIAFDRAIHVVVLSGLAIVLLTFAAHDKSLHQDYDNLMSALAGSAPGAAQVRGVIGYLGRAFKYSPAHLRVLALILFAYAALEATEAVGLWLNKRWAEYLTFVATTVLVPYEVYELTLSVSVFKVVTLVINLAVVIYLLFAKRLFGLRGGHRAEMVRRQASSGWGAIERATTPAAA